MATIGQIADAVTRFNETHLGGFDNIMQPVVIEIDPDDANDERTVFVTSRLTMAAWPSSGVVLDLEDGETRTDVLEALAAGQLEDLLRVWNVGL